MLATTPLAFFVTIFSSITLKTNLRSCFCRHLLLFGQASATRMMCAFDVLARVCLENFTWRLFAYLLRHVSHSRKAPSTTLTVSFAPHLSHALPL